MAGAAVEVIALPAFRSSSICQTFGEVAMQSSPTALYWAWASEEPAETHAKQAAT
jgi:hypothetical protein